MPRANRYFLPGHIWHITHRCHKQEFLLKFARDKKRWRYWLYEARKRYGLCVLNFIITSNHVHLLVWDRGNGEIPKSLQLISGRTAYEFNQRKHRKGAFWEDRYHATAIDTGVYLARCMTYIDLNMVRAGVVSGPDQWKWSGYREIQIPAARYRVIDTESLLHLFGVGRIEEYRELQKQWAESALCRNTPEISPSWSNSLAVGRPDFVERIRLQLGVTKRNREISTIGDASVLNECPESYVGVFDMKNM